jgi:nucleoid-associated protein YgaU
MSPGLAALEQVDPPPENPVPVQFQFNPQTITVTHAIQTKGVKGQTRADQLLDLGDVEIGIGDIIFFGPKTKPTCDTLLSWSTTHKTTVMKDGKPQAVSAPIGLKFSWGLNGLSFQVSLRTVTITYTHFAAGGTPVRAQVALELHSPLETFLPATNPTSGGPPGRRFRVVDSSQSLPSLAAASYGRAGAWRGVARANGINDPLRVRPGTPLYLPEPAGLSLADLREPGR